MNALDPAAPSSRIRHRSGSPWRRLQAWLRDVPIEDPVDRRNAPLLQVILIVLGVSIPVMAVPRWIMRWSVGLQMEGELISAATFLLAWFCLYLVRIGHFRVAAGLLVSSSIAFMSIAYATYGLRAQLPAQVTHIFPLVLGGLLLGRRALWLILAALGLCLTIGFVVDFRPVAALPMLRTEAIGNLLRSVLGLGIVALILDRAVAALRETIATSERRSEALALVRDRLQREMVERERSQAQLVQAQKMEAIGQLAGSVTHDFNNVLGVILGHVSRAESSFDPQHTMESLDGIRNAAQRGALVTRRLLGLARSDARTREVLDAGDCVREALPLLLPLLGPGIAVTEAIGAGQFPVHVARGELELALLNLASNARDAMPAGGSLTLSLTACPNVDGHPGVAIAITDTGSGMTPEVQARAFELFYTTKPRGLGTGIGLAVVQRLALECGGRVELESRIGAGTTIRLLLPLTRPAASAAMPCRPG